MNTARPGFDATLGPLPDDVAARADLRGSDPFDVILVFADSHSDLARRLPDLVRRLSPAGGLWVAWPKKASGVPTDVTEDVVRDVALPLGLVDIKVCAVDDVWSGLKLVIRRELRGSKPR